MTKDIVGYCASDYTVDVRRQGHSSNSAYSDLGVHMTALRHTGRHGAMEQ